MEKGTLFDVENLSPKVPPSSSPENQDAVYTPLAALLRPTSLDTFMGQAHLLGPGKLLRRILEEDSLRSLVLYGPSGTGKTTLAYLIATKTSSRFEKLNAVLSNGAEVKKIIEKAGQLRRLHPQKRFILFIDELHRFNTAQQDLLMPSIEEGLITLIGATTHNPFFAINGPLLSRSMIFEFKPLDEQDLLLILKRAIRILETGYDSLPIQIEDFFLERIVKEASGDARTALNCLELAVWLGRDTESKHVYLRNALLSEIFQKRLLPYDKDGDLHYDTISAFIKSIRGSDPDAAVFWLARMIKGGEDIRFIVRRLLILASEDIGNADPSAIVMTAACLNAVECVGLPEARIILSQCVIYLATAPKSNACYLAIDQAMKDVEKETYEEVPNHLKGTGYMGAKRLQHGEGYVYPHQVPSEALRVQSYRHTEKKYYSPTCNGYEATITSFLKKQCMEKGHGSFPGEDG